MSKLTGKVAVVTGASKGIGAAIAKSSPRRGHRVVNYASSKSGAEPSLPRSRSRWQGCRREG